MCAALTAVAPEVMTGSLQLGAGSPRAVKTAVSAVARPGPSPATCFGAHCHSAEAQIAQAGSFSASGAGIISNAFSIPVTKP